MKSDIEARFQHNVGRVTSMVTFAREGGPGDPGSDRSDLLRASVVFLHASLEDLIRSVVEWRLPTAAPQSLRNTPLTGAAASLKFTLADLASFRGQTVDEVIRRSVADQLSTMSYNNPTQLAGALRQVGLRWIVSPSSIARLATMMKRRHWIVHRADHALVVGAGPIRVRPLSEADLRDWIAAVEEVATMVLDQLE